MESRAGIIKLKLKRLRYGSKDILVDVLCQLVISLSINNLRGGRKCQDRFRHGQP